MKKIVAGIDGDVDSTVRLAVGAEEDADCGVGVAVECGFGDQRNPNNSR